ncbi:MAG TPA: ArsA family ATPase [Acidobacteriota bacterium]
MPAAPSRTRYPSKVEVHLPPARYLFFGGKGGVGKTTAACAAALALLDIAQGAEQILLFSTDPAHSLSDSLETRIGDELVEIARRGRARLMARQMDAPAAFEKFREKHRAILAEIANRGTLLDEEDIAELLDLSLPGMDEVMALFELSEADSSARFSRCVIDTAPTGHTARMLSLPDVFARWIGALDRIEEKHRFMVRQLTRGHRVREDEVDLFLRDLTERVQRVKKMLYDAKQCAFTLVTIPEALSVEESTRYLQSLRRLSVPVTDLIVNRVEQEHADCLYCRARVASQQPWLSEIAKRFGDLRTHRVPLFEKELRGPALLRLFAGFAWNESTSDLPVSVDSGKAQKAALRDFERSAPAREEFPLSLRKLLLFGGKGGVGKTTAAASVALALAQKNPGARVLILSTDPAHSLSDSFAEAIGEKKSGLAGLSNLDGMEMNPEKRFEEVKERYRAWTDEVFESLTGDSRWQIQFERDSLRELVSLAPPGIDEIMALSAISDLMDQDAYSVTILDTAPTGHLLRFLQIPSIAISWVHTFIRLLLKYKNVVRWRSLAEELVSLSKSIKRVAALLTDADCCEFVGVAIPEKMSLEETVRLAEALKKLKTPMRCLIINNVIPEEAAAKCEFCAARRQGQDTITGQFRKAFPALQLFIAPQQPGEVRGPDLLQRHFRQWRAVGLDGVKGPRAERKKTRARL